MLQPAAGADATDLIAVREAFLRGGLLRLHILCEPGRTIDEASSLTLTEGAYRKLLALAPDSECDDLVKARALVAVSGKR